MSCSKQCNFCVNCIKLHLNANARVCFSCLTPFKEDSINIETKDEELKSICQQYNELKQKCYYCKTIQKNFVKKPIWNCSYCKRHICYSCRHECKDDKQCTYKYCKTNPKALPTSYMKESQGMYIVRCPRECTNCYRLLSRTESGKYNYCHIAYCPCGERLCTKCGSLAKSEHRCIPD